MPTSSDHTTKWLKRLWLAAALAGYLALALWQPGLPGLHYDEAREAGLNAMELLTGAPVTVFRDAALALGDLRLPLMVQDYIGALNVYLALPFLGLTGIGVPNLRLLPVLIGLLTLLALERAVSEWLAIRQPEADNPPLSFGGLCAVTLAAFSPAFVFWSRQGIFVTNLMTLSVITALWLGVRWLRTGKTHALLLCAFMAGMALYAKLLAVWLLAPFALALAWGYWRKRRAHLPPALDWRVLFGAALLFLLPLLPLMLFNLQTLGTWQALTGNLGQSYYGVDNANLLANLGVRLPQVRQILEGSFLWYLGGIQSNPAAPWLAAVALLVGLALSWRRVLPPILLVVGTFALSLVTISDLFITHYALLQMVVLGATGAALGVILDAAHNNPRNGRFLRYGAATLVIVWMLLDLRATVGYHRLLAQSGGLGDHSDATYHLAYHLRYNGMGAPIALDWGMDATVRFLTEGAVTPIEIFGYGSPDAPDANFGARLAQFVGNPDNVYLLRAPAAEVFHGRREAFEALAAGENLQVITESTFAQRDGTPLFEIVRLKPAQP